MTYGLLILATCMKKLAPLTLGLLLVLGSCKPTPAELLDQKRQRRDDSLAVATAERTANSILTHPSDSVHETIEIMEVDSISEQSPELSNSIEPDSGEATSRLQQVLDLFSDSTLVE